jgi:uncharacterized membrane protein (DUF2068 family)
MSNSPKSQRHHNRWLVLIAGYKLALALLFFALGAGALHLLHIHKDVDDFFAEIADRLRFNPEGRIVGFLLDRASLLNDPLLRRIGAAAFCYALISLAEAIGLYLEKTWGELLTLLITASFLPWEVIEIIRRVTWPRVSLLAINIGVFWYLLQLMTQQRRQRKLRKSAAKAPEST